MIIHIEYPKDINGIKKVYEFDFNSIKNRVYLITYKEIKDSNNKVYNGVVKYRTSLIDDMSLIKVPAKIKEEVKNRFIETINFDF